MLVPLQAGTAVDNVARAIAQKMSTSLGRPIIVENVPGAAGQIGTERLARAAPDGYTIGFVNDSILTMLPNLNAKLGYDPLKDLAPVSRVAGNAFGIAVNPAFPAKSLAELIAQAKAKPGEIHYASGGNGSPQHMAIEMLASAAGVKFTHVPYKGAAQALTDVLGGQVPLLAQGLGVVSVQAKAGKLRVLAVTGTERSALLPDVPTVREAGIPDFEFATWFAGRGAGGNAARHRRPAQCRDREGRCRSRCAGCAGAAGLRRRAGFSGAAHRVDPCRPRAHGPHHPRGGNQGRLKRGLPRHQETIARRAPHGHRRQFRCLGVRR
jgi:tripartite-type tricarboxylate transporter receptor subunit TctC